jgi:hypothetical protein
MDSLARRLVLTFIGIFLIMKYVMKVPFPDVGSRHSRAVSATRSIGGEGLARGYEVAVAGTFIGGVAWLVYYYLTDK